MIKPRLIRALSLLAAISTAGCSTEDDTKTIEYYMKHAEEREDVISECISKHGGLSGAPPHCVIAATAKRNAMIDRALEATE